MWSPPTVDAPKHTVYFSGRSVNYRLPGTNTSDSVVALDLNTGEKLWAQQLMTGDVYNFGCTTEQKLNCPQDAGKNLDIGASPMLKSLGGGKRLLVVAAKSGMAYGLDPDKQGKSVWQTRIGNGGGQGGVIWGGSSDDKVAYYSISGLESREAGSEVAAWWRWRSRAGRFCGRHPLRHRLAWVAKGAARRSRELLV